MIYFVIFHPKQPGHWWARTYGHVSLLGYEKETWVHIDLTRAGMETTVSHNFDEVRGMLSYFSAYHSVVRVPERFEPKRHFMRPMTCVAMVKHALNLPSRALLPDGLFRNLTLKFNAEIMNDPVRTERK